MYAVIETGGKQYRVSPGQTLEVELLPAEPGATVTLERVLLVSTEGRTLVGKPTVAGANVVATVAREGRGEKIIVFKYKSKKRYRRKIGHRQNYTYLTITDIQAEGRSLVADEERKRYERQSARMANRYQAKLGLLVDDLAQQEALGNVTAADLAAAEIEAQAASVDLTGGSVAPATPRRTTRRNTRETTSRTETPDEAE